MRRYTLRMAKGGVLDDAARYWQERAAAQNGAERFIDSINPVTAVGSAMGGVREAGQHGDYLGAALAGAGALPMFGVLKPVGKALLDAGGSVLHQATRAGLRRGVVSEGANVAQVPYDAVKGY